MSSSPTRKSPGWRRRSCTSKPAGRRMGGARNGTVAGFYRLSRADGSAAEIEEFHLDPPMISHGVGRRMFEHACDAARGMGVSELVWSTDANTVGFYARMGGE